MRTACVHRNDWNIATCLKEHPIMMSRIFRINRRAFSSWKWPTPMPRERFVGRRNAIRQCGAPRGISRDGSARRREEMAASQETGVRAETGSMDSTGWISALFVIGFALAGSATACAPVPCPSGYADPDWCNHFRGGGGGG